MTTKEVYLCVTPDYRITQKRMTTKEVYLCYSGLQDNTKQNDHQGGIYLCVNPDYRIAQNRLTPRRYICVLHQITRDPFLVPVLIDS